MLPTWIAQVLLAAAQTPAPIDTAMTNAIESAIALDAASPQSKFDLSGEVTIGWRFLDVEGSHGQFDEDLGLHAGPIVRELLLEGKRNAGSGAIESFVVDARGIGDPQTSYRASLTGADSKVSASYDRSTYSGNTQSDFHPFDFTREGAKLRFETVKKNDHDVHAGIELDAGRGDGLSVGSRSVDFGFVSGFPVRRKDESAGIGGDLGFEALGLDIALDAGIEHLKTNDERHFAEPSPSDPTVRQTEDFRATSSTTTVRGGSRFTRTFDGGKLTTDFGAQYAQTTGGANFDSFETGILFSADDPFTRSTHGDADLYARIFRADAGLRYRVDEDLAWHVRLAHDEDIDRGNVVRDSILTEPPGAPGELVEEQALRFESTLDLLEVGVETVLNAWSRLDVSIEGGRDHEIIKETFDGAPQHLFDDTLAQYGGEATLSIEASRTLEFVLAGGTRIAPTNNPLTSAFLTFEDERGQFASLRTRWKPRAGVILTAGLQHRARDIAAFGSKYQSDSLTIGASLAPTAVWSADLTYALRLADLSADTTKVFLDPLPEQVPVKVGFDGVQNIVTGSIAYELGPRFRPRIGLSAIFATGDSRFHYTSLLADFPYRASPKCALGIELDVHRFDEESLDAPADYTATAVVVYARMGI